jgi:hypothetical protein
MSYVTTRFIDITGDGQDDAIVILKVETTGNAIPQLVYVYEWKDGKPELIWNFRTGDRADGGLKDMRIENGEVVLELYGQDRFDHGRRGTTMLSDLLHTHVLQVEWPGFPTSETTADVLDDRSDSTAAREHDRGYRKTKPWQKIAGY